jgi:hypothetical protein
LRARSLEDTGWLVDDHGRGSRTGAGGVDLQGMVDWDPGLDGTGVDDDTVVRFDVEQLLRCRFLGSRGDGVERERGYDGLGRR